MLSVTSARGWIPRRIGLLAATEISRDRDLEAAIAMSIPFLPRTPNQVGVPPRLDHGKHEFVRIGMVRFAGEHGSPARRIQPGQGEASRAGRRRQGGVVGHGRPDAFGPPAYSST